MVGDVNGINTNNGKVTLPSETRTGQAGAADTVGRGFTDQNTIAHGGANALSQNGDSRTVRLPVPGVAVSDATAQTQDELNQATAGFGALFNSNADDDVFDHILRSQLNRVDGNNGGSLEATGETANINAAMQQIKQEALAVGLEHVLTPEEILVEESTDVFFKMTAITDAPPEVLDNINRLSGDLNRALELGSMEDIAAILSKIQTELQDTRIQFDQESLQANKIRREQVHEGRVEKLAEAIKKMDEQAKSGVIGKIFGAIATALAVVVAVVLIATGVLSKVGVALMIAATGIMLAMTVSQNTGNWMNKVFGENEIAQMVCGIMWSVLAIALSLGASAATAKKGAYDVVNQAASFSTKMATYAKMASHVAKITQAGATAGSGVSDIHAASAGYEGQMYKADAAEDLAYLTKMQFHMDDMLEAIEKAIREITEGQEAASGMIRDVLDSKYSMAKNI